ncbi:SGNH/GDSL hydrolase family protein [Cohnella fermenti]|uniref:SGNH/GDSL hydrolase family protein n=1 Tax=Cohnella fermenti TaxID=2565925 RepID=A0A4S4BYK6_9BACL|nr:SGNH/GDSL hydrolase family protein [Cohnella fermenti]THF80343.1 SGNH/GDSL hydrolase family protein [Cohnella fermenti]
MSKLDAVWRRAAGGDSVVIGYFGGSITVGEGASDRETASWRALTTRWFRERFPGADIRERNAAIGGTGSDLGAFRCGEDLLDANPDLVFVEFAVNDAGTDETRVERAMEGIVRQIRRRRPEAGIVLVYTAIRRWLEDKTKQVPRSVRAHERIAKHYGLGSVDAGRAMALFAAGEAGRIELLLPDGTHPSDRGHRLYADSVGEYLEQERMRYLCRAREDRGERQLPMPSAPLLPPALHRQPLEGHLLDAWKVAQPGWRRDSRSLKGKYPHMLTANEPGTVLRFTFAGTALGIYWLVAEDSGDIEWSVDGSVPERASAWDRYATQFARAHYVLLCDRLDDAMHTCTLTILSERQPLSAGTWIRIGAFLIGGSGGRERD